MRSTIVPARTASFQVMRSKNFRKKEPSSPKLRAIKRSVRTSLTIPLFDAVRRRNSEALTDSIPGTMSARLECLMSAFQKKLLVAVLAGIRVVNGGWLVQRRHSRTKQQRSSTNTNQSDEISRNATIHRREKHQVAGGVCRPRFLYLADDKNRARSPRESRGTRVVCSPAPSALALA